MKLFKKLTAAALAGVMALSMLTGCALGDAAKENAMLKALQTVGNMYDSVDGVKVSEDKDLSKKAHSVFSAFKAAEGDAWNAEKPDDENLNMFIAKVTYKEIPYIVAVTKMPKNAKDSINWGYAAAFSEFLLLEAGHEVVGFDGLGGKAVVVPPAGEGGGDGEAAGNELLQLSALDGQDGLAHGAEDLIGQGQSQRGGAGQSGCRDVVMSHREYLSF